jgi:hypothetical protein
MMITAIPTTLPCSTMIQGVVESSCNVFLFSFFGSILFVVIMWHHERTSRLKHGRRGYVGGNHSWTNFILNP